MYKESRLRSVLKTISWRFWATVTTMLLVYIFTVKITIAATIGGIEVVLKIFLYFIHERTWDRVRFGKKEISPFVLWFTGLPSSGKTTLADNVSRKLTKNGFKVERLDGDRVRNIFPNTGFSKEERNLHIQRVGSLASILEKNGTVVVASFISPYTETRDFVRTLCQSFIEIFMATPLEECEKRDNKGLYKKARKGEIKYFTGIDDPYEVPTNPEMIIDTTNESVEKSAEKIMRYLKENKFL
ncbi:MAG: adenylyl-sulfate kinase [Thermodesulfobacteriota bacterium]|nr:adenylyl-sulfate kinase [Thermodesulfobacteriota bacterium]